MIESFEKEVSDLKLWVPDTRGSNGVMPILTADQQRFARAVNLAERILRFARSSPEPVAWRTRDLTGSGWVVFATLEKAQAWVSANCTVRGYDSIEPLYARTA